MNNSGFGMMGVFFWLFVIIKLMGSSLAAWSWFWIFVPFVPIIWLVASSAGLL